MATVHFHAQTKTNRIFEESCEIQDAKIIGTLRNWKDKIEQESGEKIVFFGYSLFNREIKK